jgi:ssDNA thymidine ADP-ribosyltransferase, DarT
MLYVISRGNHPELAYRDGQGPIIHLQADLHETITWASGGGRRWVFSLANAGARYTEFRSQAAQLDDLDWEAIAATDFRRPEVKEAKQSEFLIYKEFPWKLVQEIGVHSDRVRRQVDDAVRDRPHRPVVRARKEWCY